MNTKATSRTRFAGLRLWLLACGARRCAAQAQAQHASSRSTCHAAGRQDRGARHDQGAAAQRAAELRGRQPAAHRVRLSRHRQRARPLEPGHRPGRPAQHERGAGRRPHAPGAQPAPRRGARGHARRAARVVDHARRAAPVGADRARRPGGALRRGHAPTPSTRCATSTSAAAATAKAASSSTCPTPPPASTSASRARTSSSIPARPRCPRTCAAASTWPTSARRSTPSTRSSRATTCAW